jgi:hypothetical protein
VHLTEFSELFPAAVEGFGSGWSRLRRSDSRHGDAFSADDMGESGHADGHGETACGGVELGDLLLGASEADLESFDLAEPAFAVRLGDAGL